MLSTRDVSSCLRRALCEARYSLSRSPYLVETPMFDQKLIGVNNCEHAYDLTEIDSNSEDKINVSIESVSSDLEKFPEAEVSASSNPTHDRTYFRNKILERYPDLYYEYSNEDVNYYGITTESLCPICKLIHEDEEGIEGNYKAGSYYIKCEQRGIEIKVTV